MGGGNDGLHYTTLRTYTSVGCPVVRSSSQWGDCLGVVDGLAEWGERGSVAMVPSFEILAVLSSHDIVLQTDTVPYDTMFKHSLQ